MSSAVIETNYGEEYVDLKYILDLLGCTEIDLGEMGQLERFEIGKERIRRVNELKKGLVGGGKTEKRIDNMNSPEGRLLSYLIALGVFVVLFLEGVTHLKGWELQVQPRTLMLFGVASLVLALGMFKIRVVKGTSSFGLSNIFDLIASTTVCTGSVLVLFALFEVLNQHIGYLTGVLLYGVVFMIMGGLLKLEGRQGF